MIKAVIVDDEPLAMDGLANYVREIEFLDLVATCENPLELQKILETESVDLLFLDIQMPKMNGIDFLKMIKDPPLTIITTAYPSYALEGYELNVLDYLLKPVTFERFVKAATKAKEQLQLIGNKDSSDIDKRNDHFFIKCENTFEKIYFEDILYIQGLQNYVTIFTTKGKYITLFSLKKIEENLSSTQFIRVHKSYLVAISKIKSMERHELSVESNRIPISRNYRDGVLEKVVLGKLWKR